MADDSNQNNLPGFLRKALEWSNEAQLKTALEFLLEPYFHSGFRAARIQDHEIAALLAMRALEAVTDKEDEYELMLLLRITRMKARNLVYQVHLRTLESEEKLDEQVRAVLSRPVIALAGVRDDRTHWVLDIPNPLVMERIRQLVRKAGFLSDGSFSPSIVKLPVNAYAAVLAELVPADKRDQLHEEARKLVKSSKNMPLNEMLGEILQHAGGKLAGKAGEQLGEELSNGLLNLMQSGSSWVLRRFSAGFRS